jgi:hypothetical protein
VIARARGEDGVIPFADGSQIGPRCPPLESSCLTKLIRFSHLALADYFLDHHDEEQPPSVPTARPENTPPVDMVSHYCWLSQVQKLSFTSHRFAPLWLAPVIGTTLDWRWDGIASEPVRNRRASAVISTAISDLPGLRIDFRCTAARTPGLRGVFRMGITLLAMS